MSPAVALSEPEPGITEIRLNRPERLNALNATWCRSCTRRSPPSPQTPAAGSSSWPVRADTSAPGADLHGHGLAPGGDGSGGPQDWMAVQEHIASLVPRIRALPQPVVAAVQGAASGGGFAPALASDVRVCAGDARFNVAFARIGLSGCDIGVSWLLPRLIGSARAFEPMLTGRFVDAAEAERIGLASAVVERAELGARTLDAARAIAANNPYGVRTTKQVMWAQLETGSLTAGIAMENRTQ